MTLHDLRIYLAACGRHLWATSRGETVGYHVAIATQPQPACLRMIDWEDHHAVIAEGNLMDDGVLWLTTGPQWSGDRVRDLGNLLGLHEAGSKRRKRRCRA